jgi:putative restriction endonuclease
MRRREFITTAYFSLVCLPAVGKAGDGPEPGCRVASGDTHAARLGLHQATFREAVITAYHGRCALSGLPESLLLDAAHIVPDKDELLGQPVVPNGIPLSKIHHAAFDAHLIGIDPDYQLHVSERLLKLNDGPRLDALKRLDGKTLHLPDRMKDRPDRDRLTLRYARFKSAA